MMPLMPGATPMAGPAGEPSMAPPPAGGGGGPDMLAMLGGSPAPAADPMGMAAAASGALKQFDQIQSMIMDLAQMFPGSEEAARQMLDGLTRWRQQVVVSTSPAPAQMPGAGGMI